MTRAAWLAIAVLGLSACFDPTHTEGNDGGTGTSGADATTPGSTDPSASTNPTSATTSATDPSATTDPDGTSAPTSDPTSPTTSPDGSTTDPTDPTATTSNGTTDDTGPVDTEPPTLQFGSFLDSTHISMTFSEPMASVAGVNPAKFRPSESWWDSDDSHQVYLDLLNDFPDNNCPCITVTGLENDPGDAFTIIAELSNATNAATCMNAALQYLPVMHYDADTLATGSQITDLAGNELAEFGGQFVEMSGLSSLIIDAPAPFPDFPLPAVLLDYSAICG